MSSRESNAPDLAPLPAVIVDPVLARAFEEDLGRAGDITSGRLIPAGTTARARAVARQPGRIAGTEIAARAFHMIDPTLSVHIQCRDGTDAIVGETVLRVEGCARAILTAERVALNMLTHLSGIATLTRAYVEAVKGTKARIACTRKTHAGLRALEKYAVRAGGGINHRFGLDDALLVKDNHIAITGGIAAAVARARAGSGHMVRLEVETDTLAQVDEALAAGVDAILLDNMDTDQLREAVARIGGRAVTDASGGVTIDTVASVARTGVDVISVGALTQSARALDIGLDIDLED